MEIGKYYNHDPNHYRFKRQLDRYEYDGLKPVRRSRWVDALLVALVIACLFVIML